MPNFVNRDPQISKTIGDYCWKNHGSDIGKFYYRKYTLNLYLYLSKSVSLLYIFFF